MCIRITVKLIKTLREQSCNGSNFCIFACSIDWLDPPMDLSGLYKESFIHSLLSP